MAINEDIMRANEIIDRKFKEKNKVFHNNSSIYKFTNENIGGYYDLLNLKNKEVLTVCSSGDHILEAILRDVKRVDCFDISIFTKYFMNLKLAAVLSLEHQEFIDYLLDTSNILIFSYKIYERVRKELKQIDFESLLFWDTLYGNFRGVNIYISELFVKLCTDPIVFQNKNSSYLNKTKYYILKEKLEKYLSLNKHILFKQSDVIEIDKKFNDKYDLIFLSNIASYMDDIYIMDPEVEFYNLLENKIKTLLSKNGLIEAAYLYSEVTLRDFVNYCLNNEHFSVLSFQSFYKEKKSYILTYKK